MTTESCPQCNQPLAAGLWMCPACGTAIADDTDRTVVRADLPGPTNPPMSSPPAGLITSVPSAGSVGSTDSPSFTPPAAWAPLASSATPAGQFAPPQQTSTPLSVMPVVGVPPKNASQQWLPKVAVGLALFGLGVAAWFVLGRDDETSSATDGSAAASVVEASLVASDTASTTAPLSESSTIVPTSVPPTAPATTPPATEPAPTVPARPPWPAPPIPEPPVLAGPGLAWAVSDPLVSGMPSDEPTPYLTFAQQVFDQMAMDDWAGALSHFYFQPDGGAAGPFSFDQQTQWAAADRLSLLLVDAVPSPTGAGYDLRVAVVANFSGSASLLCGRLHSDPTVYAEVIQMGPMVLLADGDPPFMPESLLNDPARIADLQTRCV